MSGAHTSSRMLRRGIISTHSFGSCSSLSEFNLISVLSLSLSLTPCTYTRTIYPSYTTTKTTAIQQYAQIIRLGRGRKKELFMELEDSGFRLKESWAVWWR